MTPSAANATEVVPTDAAAHVGPAAVRWANAAADALRAAPGLDADLKRHGPEIALVLGSGLGPLADAIDGAVSMAYGEVPGMPASRGTGSPSAA